MTYYQNPEMFVQKRKINKFTLFLYFLLHCLLTYFGKNEVSLMQT